jgi:hypothetical protein
MPDDYALEIDGDGDGDRARVEQAQVTINHALLVGELLGVDTAPATEALWEVRRADARLREEFPGFEGNGMRLIADDQRVLDDVLGQVADALAGAIDEHGRPVGDSGRRLAASPLLAADDDGALRVVSRRLPLSELAPRIATVRRLLERALESERDVVMV